MQAQRASPTLYIEKGRLGNLQASREGIVFRDFTVLIGKQGVGKSLVAQLGFFFENLDFLSKYVHARQEETAAKVIRAALDSVRSPTRAFATFANPSVKVVWEGHRWQAYTDAPLTVSMDRRHRQVYPSRNMRDLVEHFIDAKTAVPQKGNALFVPAERIVYAHGKPNAWHILSLPMTLMLFVDSLEAIKEWMDLEEVRSHSDAEWIRRIGRSVLHGEAYRFGNSWKWRVDDATQMDIDMASSGQKANFSLVLLGQVLPIWRDHGLIGTPFTLYVEEPESHLHPEAQVYMVYLLAYLVRKGFRVVVTTHSLTIMYAINNLLLASALGDREADGVPAPDIRLTPDKVSAYLLREDGSVCSLVNEELHFIHEEELAAVDADLGAEMNRILALTSKSESSDAVSP
nr:AAA family ATPase [Ardenticatena sp.]